MRISVKTIDNLISHILVLLVICSIYAFNDQKELLYVIKISFILIMSFRLIIFNYKLNISFFWGIGFICICGISILWATDIGVAMYSFFWVLQVLLIAILMGTFIEDRIKFEYIMKCYIVGALLLVIRLLIKTPISVWGTYRIGASIGYNSNDIGMKLGFAILCVLYFFRYNTQKIFNIGIIGILGVVALLTGSKKTFLFIGISFIMYALLSTKKIYKYIMIIPLIVFFLIGSYYLIMEVEALYNVLGYRIELMMGTFNGDVNEGSTSLRLDLIKRGIELFEENPILGVGTGNYTIVSGYNVYSHNNYIEILSNLGLIGFIYYYSMYAYLFKHSIGSVISKNKDKIFILMIVFLTIFIEVGLVTYNTGYIQILLICSAHLIKINNREILINKFS